MMKNKNIINTATNDLALNTEKQLNELRVQLNKIHIEHHELSQANHEKYLQLIAIYNSNSWRYTALFRYITTKVNRLKRILFLLASFVKYEGGIVNALKKVKALYAQEGISGLKQALRTIALGSDANLNQQVHAIDHANYAEWVRQFDTLTDEDQANMRATQADFLDKPLISVLMPTYNPKVEWLIEAIESVRNQIYPHWELCIADDASTDSAIKPILERYSKSDNRIKIIFRTENGHISTASNDALSLVTGEWVVLLDHDDLLSKNALFWLANSIVNNPNLYLIYSDEDKINESGMRLDPYFKCDWNKDLFYSHNLITHLGAYRTKLLREIGGFRSKFDGAQDYDLALRCIEHIQPNQIHHIPRILYHWRIHQQSTAHSSEAKPYAMIAGEEALNQHLVRLGINAKATLIGHGYRIQYNLPENPPLVSIIIPTRNGLLLIKQCIESIISKTTYSNYEIIIIDNGSDDIDTLVYFKTLERVPCVKILRDDGPFNYSALNNMAVSHAQGELIVLVNNDIEVIEPEWLTEMVSHGLRPEVGAVGASLWYPDDTSQHGGVILGVGGWAGHSHKGFPRGSAGYAGRLSLISSFSAVTGACLLVRKNVYQTIGGLNEKELRISCSDVEFCLRLRQAGYTNVWTPFAELYHHESATRGYEDTPEKQARFASELAYMNKNWKEVLANDYAYSPNLTLANESFEYAWPPRVPTLPIHVNASKFMPMPTPNAC